MRPSLAHAADWACIPETIFASAARTLNVRLQGSCQPCISRTLNRAITLHLVKSCACRRRLASTSDMSWKPMRWPTRPSRRFQVGHMRISCTHTACAPDAGLARSIRKISSGPQASTILHYQQAAKALYTMHGAVS